MKLVELQGKGIWFWCLECFDRYGYVTKQRPGWIYMIGSGLFWKIGITTNDPQQRLDAMQIGNPEPLQLFAAWPVQARYLGERLAHLKIIGYRYRGEWFKAEPQELVSKIESDALHQ